MLKVLNRADNILQIKAIIRQIICSNRTLILESLVRDCDVSIPITIQNDDSILFSFKYIYPSTELIRCLQCNYLDTFTASHFLNNCACNLVEVLGYKRNYFIFQDTTNLVFKPTAEVLKVEKNVKTS